MHSPTTAAFRGRGARLEEKLLTVVREARKILKKGQKEVDDIMYPVNRARRKIQEGAAPAGDEPAWHGSSVEVDDLWPGAAPAQEVPPRSLEL